MELMRMKRTRLLFAAALFVTSLDARITKIAITSRAPAFNDQTFGSAGKFEKIKWKKELFFVRERL